MIKLGQDGQIHLALFTSDNKYFCNSLREQMNEPLPANEIVLEDGELVCSLTGSILKATDKERALQSMIDMLTVEYGFQAEDIERDYKLKYENQDGAKKTARIDLAVFDHGMAHDAEYLIRAIIVAKDAKVKADDRKAGALATLEPVLTYTECEFGCWTNGDDLQFLHRIVDDWGQVELESLSDFPANGQTLQDLVEAGEKAAPRKPANESLIKTFKRCHDYIYGNEGRKKDAFWELLNLIFCKLYDEKQRFAITTTSYRRRFWVGVKELNSPEGQAAVANRIKGIFEDLKTDDLYADVFDGNEVISLSNRGLAYVASEIAKYSFLDATVDVKGTAYETIVSNTLKQEAGQFFTPRNIIKCMVSMLDPDENTRVLDPACGSGGFIVMVLDHVRRKIAQSMYPELSDVWLEEKYNTPEVNDRVREYAEKMIFGFDFDPDLRKAARMNMVMAGDGHANIFNINSLEYPNGQLPDVPLIAPKVQESIQHSADKNFPFIKAANNAQGKFDMCFTNPPFGTKIEVEQSIVDQYELGRMGYKAPEVLFIEACYNFLKPGGKMAIVLPDGILGNPNTEEVRIWILNHFYLLASVDLPVETFLPQVGVQASLLFLQKKTEAEMLTPIGNEDYEVFMAIVEQVGKDRRGVPIYERDDDGAELLFPNVKKWISWDEHGRQVLRTRNEQIKHLADDLPKVSEAYKKFLEGKK